MQLFCLNKWHFCCTNSSQHGDLNKQFKEIHNELEVYKNFNDRNIHLCMLTDDRSGVPLWEIFLSIQLCSKEDPDKDVEKTRQ